jgi:hypothetical protein
MTKQFDNTNRGALFINDKKESDNHPDLSGNINVDGKDFWLSGWTKKTETGKFKVLSLSVKPKEGKAPGGRKAPDIDQKSQDFVDDQDFPF